MDDEPTRAAEGDGPDAAAEDTVGEEGTPEAGTHGEGTGHQGPGEEDLSPTLDGTAPDDDSDNDDDLGELSDGGVGGRRNALPRRVESWRSRSATGAVATAMALGLQQVFEPERRRPAAVAEAPSDPYDENDPVTVDYLPDDAEGTRVHVKPWLLEGQDPA